MKREIRESGLRAEGEGALFGASKACEKKVRRPVKREQPSKLELVEQKMSKSPNKDESRFLYRRERMIRYKLIFRGITQKRLAKELNLTESYITRLITGERYSQDFEMFLKNNLEVHYCFI